MKYTKKIKDWRVINLIEEGEDACGVWESYYVDEFMTLIDSLLESQRQELNKKVKEIRKDKRIPYQACHFGDCPKCGQEVNRKWVDKEIKEVKDQALNEVIKLLDKEKKGKT